MSFLVARHGAVAGKKKRWGFLCNADSEILYAVMSKGYHALEFEGIAYNYNYGERILSCEAKLSGPGINGTQSEYRFGWGKGFLRNFGVTRYYPSYGTIPFPGEELHIYLFQLEGWGDTWKIYRDGILLATGSGAEDTGANGYDYRMRLFEDYVGIITKYRVRTYYYPYSNPNGRYWLNWGAWKYFDSPDSDISMWKNPGGMVKF